MWFNIVIKFFLLVLRRTNPLIMARSNRKSEEERKGDVLSKLERMFSIAKSKMNGHTIRSIENKLSQVTETIGKRASNMSNSMCIAIREKNLPLATSYCDKILSSISKKKQKLNKKSKPMKGGDDEQSFGGNSVAQTNNTLSYPTLAELPNGHLW